MYFTPQSLHGWWSPFIIYHRYKVLKRFKLPGLWAAQVVCTKGTLHSFIRLSINSHSMTFVSTRCLFNDIVEWNDKWNHKTITLLSKWSISIINHAVASKLFITSFNRLNFYKSVYSSNILQKDGFFYKYVSLYVINLYLLTILVYLKSCLSLLF